MQCKVNNGDTEEHVAVNDWDEGEVSGYAEQLVHSAIDDPEWGGLILAETTRYAGPQSCHSSLGLLTTSIT